MVTVRRRQLKVSRLSNRLLIGFGMLLGLLAMFFFTPHAAAVTAADWNAGNIIDDSLFFNPNEMSTNDIQNFLNSKVPVCDTSGTQPYAGTTRAVYGASRGYPAPYTCLKNYVENPTTHQNNANGGAVSGGWTSAQIIKYAADTYSINPKALIVLLQKEQSLVTDDWPWTIQYQRATGYGCPDSTPGVCDASYYGFYNQVVDAAYQFRRYATYPGDYRYKANQSNYIQYNPNVGCGGTNVIIANQATAGLYNYTPYQPNASALANLYGSGDGCGAYGNRNFWRLYNDWFGTTHGDSPNYIWNFETLDGSSQSVSTTNAKVGNYPTTVNLNGSLHVFYYDIQNGNLKHAWIASGVWNFETLDGAGGSAGRVDSNVGGFTKALMFNNQIYLFYKDFQNGDLRMATFDGGTGWSFETLDGAGGSDGRINADVGWDIDATSDATSLHVFYSDATSGNLRHAWKTSGSWGFETLDGDTNSVTKRSGNIGQGIKSQFVGNSIHLFYYDDTATNLVHTWFSPALGWRSEYLDGSTQSISGFNAAIGRSPSFVYVNNSFHVFYYDIERGALRHAWFDPARSWRFEHLDGIPGAISHYSSAVGLRSSVVMEGPIMNVFYYNATNQAIRHAWFDPTTGWHFINLDGGLYSVGQSGLNMGENLSTVLWNGDVQVFYFDGTNQTLRHAWGAPR